MHLVNNHVANHVGILAADQKRHGVRPKNRNERKDQRGNDTAFNSGNEHQIHRLRFARTQIARGFQQRKIKTVNRRKNRQNGVRQIHIHADKDYRALIVEQLHVVFRYVQGDENSVDYAAVVHNGHPRKDSDKRVRPKRNDDEKQKQGLIPTPCHCVTARQGKRNRNRRRNSCDFERAQNQKCISRLEHLRVCFQRKFRYNTAVQTFFHKAVDKNNRKRRNKK